MTSIPKTPKKIKSQEYFTLGAVIIAGSIGAFFLGRWSAQQSDIATVQYQIAACPVPLELQDSVNVSSSIRTNGAFVGTQNGKSYYPAECPAAHRLLQQILVQQLRSQLLVLSSLVNH
jgi:hypothetical protein